MLGWSYKFIELKEKYDNKFYVYEDNNNHRKFMAFDSHLTYYDYMMNLTPNDRNHYETILGDTRQKPRFDIDISGDNMTDILTPEDILNDLIYNIISHAKSYDYDINMKDILLYQSHGIDKTGKYKYSFHIVINNWYHKNNKEAKAFYNGVVSNMQYDKSVFVDSSVYKSLQQFRMLGNCKYGSNRFKTRMYEYKLYNTNITWDKMSPIVEFINSLITIYSGEPKHMSIPIVEVISEKNELHITNMGDITLPQIFEIQKETSYGIRLQRKKDIYGKNISGACPVCKDRNGNSIIHDNDNAFITKKDESIYFHCFRNPKLKKLIHVIKKPSNYKLALEASLYRNNTYDDYKDGDISILSLLKSI